MSLDRREFVRLSSLAAGAAAAGRFGTALASSAPAAAPLGKAEHLITIWLGGGMAQIDTFDPKRRGDPRENIPGSDYAAIPTAVPGVDFCEHLSALADRADRLTAVRTVHHDVIDEHAAATLRVHTGRPTSGTIQYPSLGAIAGHELGLDGDVPAYVLMGFPSVARGSGFLGPKHSYLYLTDATQGPPSLRPASPLDETRRGRRAALLKTFAKHAAETDPLAASYNEMVEKGRRLSAGSFMKAFDLDAEPAALRERYGDGLGQRCLAARRLVERGVSSIELSHHLNFSNGTGWDTHREGQLTQHVLIQDLDRALATLLDDLEAHGLLDKTLVTIGTEFGRPAAFDSGGGRGHHGKVFTLVVAGGGLNHRGAFGVSNELAELPVEDAVSVPDFHATTLAGLGIPPSKLLYDPNGRPVPITDGGRAIGKLFA